MAAPLSFAHRIRRLLLLFGLVAIPATVLLHAFLESREIKDAMADNMIAAARASKGIIAAHILQYQDTILTIINQMPAGSDREVARYFHENLPLLGPNDHYFILDRNHRVIYVSDTHREMIGLDFSNLPSIKEHKPVSAVHQSLLTLNPVVSLLYPLTGDRLLLVEKDLSGVIPLVRHLTIAGLEGQAFLFILASDGTVVCHPDRELVESRHNLGFEITDWEGPDAYGLSTCRYRGVEHVSYRESLTMPLGWTFYATVPARAMTDHLIRYTIFPALLPAALLFGLLFLLQATIDRRLSRPVHRISDALARLRPFTETREVSEGLAAGTEELHRIVVAFNSLLQDIRDTTAQLAESEDLFRTMTEFATDWIYWLAPDHTFIYVSPACTQISGYSPKDFYASPALMIDLVHPDDRHLFKDHFHEALGDIAHEPLEFRIVTKEGATRWIRHICRGIHDQQGRFLGVRGSNIDITAEKAMEARLRQSEERFRNLVEQAADSIIVHDLDGRIIDINSQAAAMSGYSREELLGMTIPELDEHYNLDRARALWDTLEPGRPQTIEGLHRRKDGTLLPVEVRIGLVQHGGRQRQVLGLVRDITERKQAAEALAAEKELLSVTLRSIGDGVITTDRNGRINLMSKMAENLTGWNQGEAQGRKLAEVLRLVAAEDHSPRPDPVQEVLATGRVVTLDASLLEARDGSRRLIADSAAPIRDQQSAVIGVAVIFRDITEQRRLEEEALKAQKLESLGILAGGIAHDFNNLLTAVVGNLSLLKSHVEAGSPLTPQLDAAEKAAQRAQGLTQQLLTFAKGGAPVRQATSIAELVSDSVDFVLRGSAVGRDVALNRDLWAVDVDPGQMSQVINNLVINAAQAMAGGGTIRIRGANQRVRGDDPLPLMPGRYVHIAVSDEGQGIPAKYLSSIFDPYFTTKKEGSGLGLASSYSIVKRHNGCITVESEEGRGAIFHVYLPASEREPAPACHPGDSAPPTGEGKILVMDDEELVRHLAAASLKRLGYQVELARDGDEALAKYQEAAEAGAPFDAVIMDLTIPGGKGGRETIQELRRLDPDLLAIVSSGYAQDPIMAEYRDYGFTGVLVKPYTLHELAQILQQTLSCRPSRKPS